jgi:non-ribosomal peptide synthetase component F
VGGRVSFGVDAPVHAGLLRLARDGDASLFMVLQAGVAALLSRLGAGVDVPLGTVVAGRSDVALDELVGFFVNTLVLRTDTSGNPSFSQLVARAREVYLAADAHQDVPFEQVVERLNPPRSAARHPLFQVMLVLQGSAETPGDFGSVVAEPTWGYLGSTVAKFDLGFSFVERRGGGGVGAGLEGELEYSAGLFDAGTAQAVVDRLVRLLTVVAADPGVRIGQVELLSVGERDRLLGLGCGPVRGVPECGVVELFERRVLECPDAVAVVCGDEWLSYRDLDVRAGGLAGRLVAAGVGPECPVVVLVERSVGLVVSLLAVLRAGGFYVPLPEGFPAVRVRQVVGELGVGVVLVDEVFRGGSLVGGLVGLGVREVVVDGAGVGVDGVGGVGGVGGGVSRGVVAHPDQLMYAMYTSGSTGVPKGVAVTHRNVVGLVCDPVWSGGGCARVLAHSPYSFDASTFELWVPLLSGGCVVVAPAGELGVAELDRVVVGQGVTCAWFTSALFDLLVQESVGTVGRLREVWTGGEAVSPVSVGRVLSECSGTAVFNGYGPTESTTFATCHRVSGGVVGNSVPIGRPLANTGVYVLDAGLRLVPVGVVGELYLAGVGWWGESGLCGAGGWPGEGAWSSGGVG